MPESIVQTQEGLIKGFVEKSRRGKTIYRFLGVPYAEPPVGELRFKVINEYFQLNKSTI